MPEDAEYVLQRTRNVHGFYGASSVERFLFLLPSFPFHLSILFV